MVSERYWVWRGCSLESDLPLVLFSDIRDVSLFLPSLCQLIGKVRV